MILLNFLQNNSIAITLIFSFIAAIVKFWQYVDIKRNEQKQKKFENYHKLVERLTAPLTSHESTYMNVQEAAVFEMRNYPEYKEVTDNIFQGWIKRESILSEKMKDTLSFLNK